MMKGIVYLLLFIISFSATAQQEKDFDPLPDFSVKAYPNKSVVVRWLNTNPQIQNINIQRSYDSVIFFRTIGVSDNPSDFTNEFVDKTPESFSDYYRLFIFYNDGSYIFTKSKQPIVADNITTRPSFFNQQESLSSILNSYVPSQYVYTALNGNIYINTPFSFVSGYSIKIFDDKNREIIHIDPLPDFSVTLDKSNFRQAGWYKFEFYFQGKVIDRNKFYVYRNFK